MNSDDDGVGSNEWRASAGAWTRTGAFIPSDNSPSKVFARLFLEGNAGEVQEQMLRLEDGRSILDDVGGEAKSLRGNLGSRDWILSYSFHDLIIWFGQWRTATD